jgi:hypothetical protein
LPLFHFRFDDGAGAADTEGLNLPGVRQAQAEAVLLLSELLQARPENHWVGKSAAVTVTDAAGAMLLRIEISGPPKG